jgi:hypothetical protein
VNLKKSLFLVLTYRRSEVPSSKQFHGHKNNREAWTTSWLFVNPSGVGFLPVLGVVTFVAMYLHLSRYGRFDRQISETAT